MMLQMALGCVKNGIKTTIISLEMTADQVWERMFALEMEIDLFSYKKMRGEFLPQSVFEGLTEFAKRVETYKQYVHVIDDYGYTTDEMIELFENIYEEKPQLVLIDHLQHIRCGYKKTLEAIDDYLLMMKEFAKKNNICFVILSQLNRAGAEKPNMTHLKSSGKIEEVSDTVILLEPDKLKPEGDNCKIHIVKQRYGPVGVHEVYFCLAFTKFYNNYDEYMNARNKKVKTINLAKDFKTYVSMAVDKNHNVTKLSYQDPLDALVERDCEV